MNYYNIIKSPIDDLLLVADESKLLGIYFNGRKHAPVEVKQWKRDAQHPVLRDTEKQLQEYFAGKRKDFSVPFHFTGTQFQEKVWKEIAKIPFGKTISYTELAQRAGLPEAVRAAGANTGLNPISIVIPCHRVVGKDGRIVGYAGGVERKRHLLELENALPKATKRKQLVLI